jgi:hypothetical protein
LGGLVKYKVCSTYVIVKGTPSLGKRLERREKRYLLDEVCPPFKLITFCYP